MHLDFFWVKLNGLGEIRKSRDPLLKYSVFLVLTVSENFCSMHPFHFWSLVREHVPNVVRKRMTGIVITTVVKKGPPPPTIAIPCGIITPASIIIEAHMGQSRGGVTATISRAVLITTGMDHQEGS